MRTHAFRGRTFTFGLRHFQILAILLPALAAAVLGAGQQWNPEAKPAAFKNVGIEQKLDSTIPLDLRFTDEEGKTVKLADFFQDRPVVLALVYYQCPMLCPMVLEGMEKGFKDLRFDVGNEFEVVTVSINPEETPEIARQKKAGLIQEYGRAGAENGWHFLTGREENIRKLADAVGFHYKYDPESKQYIHAAGIMVATPQGKLARYFYGIDYSPTDLRLGLVEASDDKIGSPVDQILLYCCQYDPTTGKYGIIISRVERLAALTTVLGLALLVLVLIRHERKKRHPVQSGQQGV